ncbi:arsenical resistance protein ArsH [Nitzschia inconspicua]|uniref:Arsenical resistance protein ArsH n=1 Tax=Nitzschia inconspicua TaxID=303405 RepID=A0A9K3LRH5_9STRA|nr:arsenical resistance protein ArsH [Nitzschia inconspicua]
MPPWARHSLRVLVPLSIASRILSRRSVAPSGFPSSSSYREMTSLSTDPKLWDGSDETSFYSSDHPGYTLESDSTTFVGGWHAHRKVWEEAHVSNGDAADGASSPPTVCWIKEEVMPMITKFDYSTMPIGRPPRILVLYGSLRPTSFSRKSAYEFARLLDLLGCDVRVYNPKGLPVRDPDLENELKVLELRALTLWSDGHMWVSPEMHGTITGTFKNQIDWIPLNTGSVRPTQGRTCCVAQVNGGSQSFNAVNALRLLARWMRMPCCTNQSSVAKAWKEFDDYGRMKPSDFRDRVVDVAEEFAKFTAVMAPYKDSLTDRYSERKETLEKGRLLTQAEKEASNEKAKTIQESRKG